MNATHARAALAYGFARAAAARIMAAYPELEGGEIDLARDGVDYRARDGEAMSILDLLGPMGEGVRLITSYEAGAWSGLVEDADGHAIKVDCVTAEPATTWIGDFVAAAHALLAR